MIVKGFLYLFTQYLGDSPNLFNMVNENSLPDVNWTRQPCPTSNITHQVTQIGHLVSLHAIFLINGNCYYKFIV